jgi:hypothetical protein
LVLAALTLLEVNKLIIDKQDQETNLANTFP